MARIRCLDDTTRYNVQALVPIGARNNSLKAEKKRKEDNERIVELILLLLEASRCRIMLVDRLVGDKIAFRACNRQQQEWLGRDGRHT